MKQSKEMEKFDREFIGVEDDGTYKSFTTDLVKQFISQNYYPKSEAIPKAEVEKIITVDLLRSSFVKNDYNCKAIEDFIKRVN